MFLLLFSTLQLFFFVLFFLFCFYLEFLVALRLAERRRKSIVGAAVVAAATGCDGQRCNRVTAATGYQIQFPLAGFAENGQSPFAPRKYKSKKLSIELSIIKEIMTPVII